MRFVFQALDLRAMSLVNLQSCITLLTVLRLNEEAVSQARSRECSR